MKNKKIINAFVIVCLSLVLLLNSFFILVFNNSFYQKQFEKKNLQEKFIDKNIVEINSGLLSYLSGGETYDREFFSDKENIHLEDVRSIFDVLRTVYIVLLLVLLVLLYYAGKIKEELFGIIKKNFLSVLFLVLFSFLLMPFFDNIFYVFHQLVFSNDYWLLDSATSNLINMYPGGIFLGLAIRILLTWLMISFILYLFALGFIKYKKE